MKATLALDLGTSCGWAFSPAGQTIFSGVWDLRPGRHCGGGMRFAKFVASLNALYDAKTIELVVYEEIRNPKGATAEQVYGGLMSTLTAWCEAKQIPYQGIGVGRIKKFATGKGNASKTDVVLAVEAWGYQPANDDEADAIALLRCVNAEHRAAVRPFAEPANACPSTGLTALT
jgi:crossover junction endodeoxyribonuclease RuvC